MSKTNYVNQNLLAALKCGGTYISFFFSYPAMPTKMVHPVHATFQVVPNKLIFFRKIMKWTLATFT